MISLSVVVPSSLSVSATTGQQEVLSKSDSVWVDRCEYRNLIVGEKYRMFGELINKDTGERIEISGSTAETVFVPTEKDGYVDVTFEVDSSLPSILSLSSDSKDTISVPSNKELSSSYTTPRKTLLRKCL